MSTFRLSVAALAGALITVSGVGLPVAAEPSSAPSAPPAPSAPSVTPDEVEVSVAGAMVALEGEVEVGIAPADLSGNWEAVAPDRFSVDASDPDVSYDAVVGDDGVAVIAELADRPPSDDLAFHIDLAPGTTLALDDDGSIAIVDPDGIARSGFEPPWAVDATGAAIPTRYRVEGDTIVQTVDHDAVAAYPVLADPKFTTGWTTGTVYFNVRETIDIGDASSMTVACGPLALGGPVGVVLAAVCGLQWNSITWTARKARREGKCLKIKYPLSIVVTPTLMSPGTYSGGYCTK